MSDRVFKVGLYDGYLCLLGVLSVICCLFFRVRDFIFIYLYFEGVLIPIMFIILGWGRQPERFEAGLAILIYTVIGSLPLLLLLIWVWSVGMRRFFLLGGVWVGGSSWVITILLGLAFCVKIPLFGLHGWLPKAHVEAPVAGSIMLAGVLLKMGVYGLVMMWWYVGLSYIWVLELLSVLGGVGGCVRGVICIYQRDMKALIAYSSVSHICFLILGFVRVGWLGWEGVILISLSHGVCSPWLFFIANYLSDVKGTRSLYLLKGVLLVFPTFSLCMFLRVCRNIAVPPCVALVGELCLFISGGNFSIHLITPMIFMCFIARAYSLGLYSLVNHGNIGAKGKMEGVVRRRYILGSVLALIPLVIGLLVVDIFRVRI